MNRYEEIDKFVHAEHSLVQKAKRYDADIKYLLSELMIQSHRHALCEENISFGSTVFKDKQLRLLSDILEVVNANYDSPFKTYKELTHFHKYNESLMHNNVDKIDIGVLHEILKLITEYHNAPAAC